MLAPPIFDIVKAAVFITVLITVLPLSLGVYLVKAKDAPISTSSNDFVALLQKFMSLGKMNPKPVGLLPCRSQARSGVDLQSFENVGGPIWSAIAGRNADSITARSLEVLVLNLLRFHMFTM